MPIIKSAIKRARQQTKRRSHNLVVRHAVKKDVKAVMSAIAAGDVKATETALREAASELDRAVKKGTLHKNTAARRKSRLTKLATKTFSAEAKPAAKAATKKPAAKKAAPKKTVAKK